MATYEFKADITRFVANTTRYRGENALVLADCAKLAYEDRDRVCEALTGQWGFRNFRFFNRDGTQAYVAANDDIILVAFRGTEPNQLRDWMTDLQMKLVDGAAGKVHNGVQKGLMTVWNDHDGNPGVSKTIDQFQDRGQSVWVTGHSLGAALATLAVAEMTLRDDRPVNGLVTIGQPRTGDREFATAFNAVLQDRCFRFINNNDLVTRLLPRATGYSHVGRALYIDDDGDLHDDLSWWIRFLNRVKSAVDDIGDLGPDAIADHASADYVSLIEKNRDVTTRWS